MYKNFWIRLQEQIQKGPIPEKFQKFLTDFVHGYLLELEAHSLFIEEQLPLLETYLKLVEEQCHNPYCFQPYHQHILAPFNYYSFGLEFLRPLVDFEHSSIQGLEYLDQIQKLLAHGNNVILFSNHQTEADPQAISLLLEKTHPDLGREMIFVAGDRVVTDPLAIPFSMGRNLLCIYSKRYIEHPPEMKHQKQLHNKRTMQQMSALLSEGGKVIYVAPSGGRDRANAQGVVEVAHFDPQSIEMFHLMAKKAKHRTHFYTLALATYALLPPPQTIQVELGEQRLTKRGNIHLAFGPEIEMEKFSDSAHKDKHTQRELRAAYIWKQVKKDYSTF